MADYPVTIGFNTAEFRSSDRTLVDEMYSGQVNVRKVAAQFYQCTLRYNKLTRAEFAPINAFIESLRGQYTPFDIILPDISSIQGSGGGTPLVAGASQTGLTLDIDGASLSTSGWMKANDVFRLAGHNKVYRLTADADTDGTGAVTLALAQPLMESPADGEALTIDNVPFSMRLASSVQKYAMSRPLFYQFEIDIREAL